MFNVGLACIATGSVRVSPPTDLSSTKLVAAINVFPLREAPLFTFHISLFTHSTRA